MRNSTWPSVLGWIGRGTAGGLLIAALGTLGGCDALAFFATTSYRSSDHAVTAKYSGLQDKSFAVVVAADRAIQADYPDALTIITVEVTKRIADNAGASGMVTAQDVLKYQYQHPRWVTLSPTELAKELGVDRVVYIDMQDYTLTDPGNPYLWAGRASGTVSVAEAENNLGAITPFREYINVKFPDNDSSSSDNIPASTVQLALLKRFVDRAAWMFYDHDESNIIKY